MTSLVCIGHGKSGTTFLDRFFRNRTQVAVPKRDKEIKYFNEETVSLAGYAAHFDLEAQDFHRPGFLSFEASPPYVTNQKRRQTETALLKLRDTLPDPRIIIAVRDPLRRAVSHYAHTLYEISQRGFPPLFRDLEINYHGHPQPDAVKRRILDYPGPLPIEEALADPEICSSSYADCYELAVDLFGKDRVMVFWMEKDLADFDGFIDRLKARFDLTFNYDPEKSPIALKGRGAPYYRYGNEDGAYHEIDGHRFFLHPQQLLIVRSEPALLLDGVTPDDYERLEQSRRRWTIDISPSHAADIYWTYLAEDYNRFLRLYDQHHGALPYPDYAEASINHHQIKPATFEGMVAARLIQEGEIKPFNTGNAELSDEIGANHG